MSFTVTEKAERPAGRKGECFYCQSKVGLLHADDCVLVSRKVKIVATIVHEVTVPAKWDKDMIEFHRNEGSWCATNFLAVLEKMMEENNGCLCSNIEFHYVSGLEENPPFLEE